MDIERLTARNKNGLAYLVKVKPNEQEVDSPYKNTLKCILDCFERLAQYEEAEIAKQSIVTKLATSEDVAEAIEWLESEYVDDFEGYPETCERFNWMVDLAITALQAYEPWVSVSDRLPDGNMASVLIYTKEGGVAEGQYYPSIKAWKQFRWSVEDSSVTHWKPLPQPPKGETT